MFIASTVLLILAVGQALSQNNGYVMKSVPDIPCTAAPKSCSSSLGYKIPDWSKVKTEDWSNMPFKLEDLRAKSKSVAIMIANLKLSVGDRKCITLQEKYFCALQYSYRCAENLDYIDVDEDGLKAKCNETKRICDKTESPTKTFGFGHDIDSEAERPDCSVGTGGHVRIQRKYRCSSFPTQSGDDPLVCRGNYKVFAGNTTLLKQQKDVISFLHKMLKRYSNVTDAECQKAVAEVVCKATIPACSKDQTKIVSLLSKQDCRKTVGCVNQTKNADLIKGANGMCQNLPDSVTAKPYSLDNVYDNKAGNRATAFSTILVIATMVAKLFF